MTLTKYEAGRPPPPGRIHERRDHGGTADQIARTLPRAVDKLTPSGEMPAGASLKDLIKQQSL
ncbi:hypothetical protein [Streptomyces sp. NPDC060027]|uniref:hypothetical protein n=1 Tax=Streptomyces sp. NPDC060027 TaxID=3347040 RepID=UPI003696F166